MTSFLTHDCIVAGLSYCRHLKTVRTHLAGLVSPTVVSMTQPSDAGAGLTEEAWRKFLQEVVDLSDMFESFSHLELLLLFREQGFDEQEIYRLVYFGGCAHSLRAEVSPELPQLAFA